MLTNILPAPVSAADYDNDRIADPLPWDALADFWTVYDPQEGACLYAFADSPEFDNALDVLAATSFDDWSDGMIAVVAHHEGHRPGAYVDFAHGTAYQRDSDSATGAVEVDQY